LWLGKLFGKGVVKYVAMVEVEEIGRRDDIAWRRARCWEGDEKM
jgi:hypothetical protein